MTAPRNPQDVDRARAEVRWFLTFGALALLLVLLVSAAAVIFDPGVAGTGR